MKIRSLLACFLILGFVASIIAVPALGMGRAPSKASKAVATEGEDVKFPGLSSPAKKEHLSNKPNPDPGHLKGPDRITPAHTGDPIIHVYPRCLHVIQPQIGTYRDVDNVQWAVDNVASGGTVRLMTTDPDDGMKKAFYFGEGEDSGWIGVDDRCSVKIIGEKETGSPLASNWYSTHPSNASYQLPQGGFLQSDRAVVYGGGRNVVNVYADGKQFELEAIRFEKPKGSAVNVSEVDGLKISDTIVTDVKPTPLPLTPFIYRIPFNIGAPDAAIPWDNISGNITIEYNYTDSYPNQDGPDQFFNLSFAVSVGDFDSPATVYINNNVFKNPGMYGIFLGGIPDTEVFVANNTISLFDNFDNPHVWDYVWGSGVWVTFRNFPPIFRDSPKKVHISGCTFNNIIKRGIFFRSTGANPGPKIENCTLNLPTTPPFEPNAFGIALGANTFQANIQHNVFSGNAQQAYSFWGSTHNCYTKTYQGDFVNFTGLDYVVWFTENTHDNTLEYYAPELSAEAITDEAGSNILLPYW